MKVLVAVVLVAFSCVTADAQGTATSSISGTAVDSAGGVIPGASVVVTNKATGTKFNAVTSGAGTFTVPSLDTGVYTVSVSLMGFKTAGVDDVQLRPGTPTEERKQADVPCRRFALNLIGVRARQRTDVAFLGVADVAPIRLRRSPNASGHWSLRITPTPVGCTFTAACGTCGF